MLPADRAPVLPRAGHLIGVESWGGLGDDAEVHRAGLGCFDGFISRFCAGNPHQDVAIAWNESQMLISKNVDNTVRWKQGERLNHYFEQQCDSLPPEQLAVITEDVSVTFRELDNRANQAARFLL